jgi:hypothetical protein
VKNLVKKVLLIFIFVGYSFLQAAEQMVTTNSVDQEQQTEEVEDIDNPNRTLHNLRLIASVLCKLPGVVFRATAEDIREKPFHYLAMLVSLGLGKYLFDDSLDREATLELKRAVSAFNVTANLDRLEQEERIRGSLLACQDFVEGGCVKEYYSLGLGKKGIAGLLVEEYVRKYNLICEALFQKCFRVKIEGL